MKNEKLKIYPGPYKTKENGECEKRKWKFKSLPGDFFSFKLPLPDMIGY